MMEWTDALRKYAEMKGQKFRIYKKGTPEHAEIKKLQASGKGALTKKDVKKITSKMAAEAAGKAPRKPRSDIGKKRITTKQIVDESVKQKLVSKAVAYGRKERKDKGVKRGPRKAKEAAAPVVQFDEEGNLL
jgi:hypothetical protein